MSQWHCLLTRSQNLIDLDKPENLSYKKALEESNRQATFSRNRADCLELRCARMRHDVFQVVLFNLLSQCAVLSVVAQSAYVLRDLLWPPIWLSLVVGLCSCSVLLAKGRAIAILQVDLHRETIYRQNAEKAESLLRSQGLEFPLETFKYPSRKDPPKSFNHFLLPYYVILVLICLFTLLIVVSEWRIIVAKDSVKPQ